MMKYLTLFAIIVFASILQSTMAQEVSSIEVNDSSKGFKLKKRVRSARKLSEINERPESIQDANLRQWKEEDYDAIMSTMSGQSNLRHRQMQQGGDYQKKPYYTMQQTTVMRWQKIVLSSIVMAVIALALYVCSLRKELSALNQYLPLGYKLFSEADVPEEESNVDGVEMS
mmetsp:Transcript_10730/g.23774  ORF Transcript_10730/g.23774 Transcript_10730/m.23774 type:complete len:171 (-) Transcript_10730:14-526(-)